MADWKASSSGAGCTRGVGNDAPHGPPHGLSSHRSRSRRCYPIRRPRTGRSIDPSTHSSRTSIDGTDPRLSHPTLSRILLVSLDKDDWLDCYYAPLLGGIDARAERYWAKQAVFVDQYLAEYRPRAVFVTDGALCVDIYRSLLESLVAYVWGGGTVVFGAQFSSQMRPADLSDFFRGGLGRAVVVWAGSAYNGAFACRHEARVAEGEIRPTHSSVVDNPVNRRGPADVNDAAVAYARVGCGWLGYVGDMNHGPAGDLTILNLFGLLLRPPRP
ncbi:MAG: hypothetical protein M1838_002402 [Thelocarpon superellum]|nr:MAG: hypothetical protein M1838_002402 [Thelocarpon superellum]